jgi:hypothetical protein
VRRLGNRQASIDREGTNATWAVALVNAAPGPMKAVGSGAGVDENPEAVWPSSVLATVEAA